MGKFGASLKRTRKVDNNEKMAPAKIDIRRRVLAAIGADEAIVFDAFAGAGQMYEAVWRDARTYIGCDHKFFNDRRSAFVADNRRVLRAIDLGAFNIFDLDAYGSPWEQAIIIASRKDVEPGDKIGFVLTEGSGLKLKQGGIPLALACLAGVTGKPAAPQRLQADLITAAIAGMCKRLGARVERRWQADNPAGASMKYIGLVLCGVG